MNHVVLLRVPTYLPIDSSIFLPGLRLLFLNVMCMFLAVMALIFRKLYNPSPKINAMEIKTYMGTKCVNMNRADTVVKQEEEQRICLLSTDLVTLQAPHAALRDGRRIPLPFLFSDQWPHHSPREHRSKNKGEIHKMRADHSSSNICQAEIKEKTAKTMFRRIFISQSLMNLAAKII